MSWSFNRKFIIYYFFIIILVWLFIIVLRNKRFMQMITSRNHQLNLTSIFAIQDHNNNKVNNKDCHIYVNESNPNCLIRITQLYLNLITKSYRNVRIRECSFRKWKRSIVNNEMIMKVIYNFNRDILKLFHVVHTWNSHKSILIY